MKKNLLYLFTILCTLSFVTSCSDDDDDKALNAWKNLATDYTGANLTLTINGTAATDKTVKLDAISADSATIAMTDVIAEVASVDMGVKLTRNTTGYDISGSKNISGFVISVTGKVTDDSKMTLAVTTKGWELPIADYTGDKLALQLNGETVADKTVAFKSTSKTEAEVILKNIVPEMAEVIVPVKLLIVKAEVTATNYEFEGVNNSIEGYKISAKGSVNTLGVMTLDLDVVTTSDPTLLDGIYSTTELKNTLALTYSGSKLIGESKTVSFKALSDETATITLAQIIPGELSTAISDVQLIPGIEGYTFEGTNTKDGREMKYSGSIENGKMALDLQVTMPTNALVGTWNLSPLVESDLVGVYSSSPIYIATAHPDKDMESFWGIMQSVIQQLAAPQLQNVLNNVTFLPDGNIVASYAKTAEDSTWQDSPLNLAQYYVKDNKLYLLLNVEMIQQAAQTKAETGGKLEALMELVGKYLVTGVPLNYKIEDGHCVVYIDKEFLMPIMEALAELMQTLPDDMLDQIGALIGMEGAAIKEIATLIVTLVTTSSQVDLGLSLEKAQ